MTQEELIELYLTNRLRGQDKVAFENKLEKSLKLKEEVELEKQIIDGINAARAKELKSILSATNVSLHQLSTYPTLKKSLLATLSVIITGVILYLTIRTWSPKEPVDIPPESTGHIALGDSIKKENATKTLAKQQEKEKGKSLIRHRKAVNSKELTPSSKENNVEHPVAPMEDVDFMAKQDTPFKELDRNASHFSPLSVNHFQNLIRVKLDSTHQKYTFHYRFIHSKLFLYGPFKEDSYELIALKKDDSIDYLHYKEKYYTLNKKNLEVSKLKAVQDSSLLKLLKDKTSK